MKKIGALSAFVGAATLKISMAHAGPPPGGPPMEDGLAHRVAELEEAVAALQAKLACISESSTSTELFFERCNVHVRNGTGKTNSVNGRGNLIIGYDAERTTGSSKMGSHNVVIGDHHNYTRFGGLVAGFENAITGDWSSISGGLQNTASGEFSSVSGGVRNSASGPGFGSSVSGGQRNLASGDSSSISGGAANIASGFASSISGGVDNEASASWSAVGGGHGCKFESVFATRWGVGDADRSSEGCFTKNDY